MSRSQVGWDQIEHLKCEQLEKQFRWEKQQGAVIG